MVRCSSKLIKIKKLIRSAYQITKSAWFDNVKKELSHRAQCITSISIISFYILIWIGLRSIMDSAVMKIDPSVMPPWLIETINFFFSVYILKEMVSNVLDDISSVLENIIFMISSFLENMIIMFEGIIITAIKSTKKIKQELKRENVTGVSNE